MIWEFFGTLIERGGWAMWPLLALSFLAVTLIFERIWFWLYTNSPGHLDRYERIARLLRQQKHSEVAALVADDRTVYGHLVQRMLEENTSDAVITDVIESQRGRLERFMTTLGTIITAAPMLGILGTVTGLMNSIGVLGQSSEEVADATALAAGISEALLTTATGLVIALIVLIPFNAFRSRIDRSLGRFETLIAAARGELPLPTDGKS